MEAAAKGLNCLSGPHLGPPSDGFSALQLLAVERQQVDEVVGRPPEAWHGSALVGPGYVAVAQIDGGVSARSTCDMLPVVGQGLVEVTVVEVICDEADSLGTLGLMLLHSTSNHPSSHLDVRLRVNVNNSHKDLTKLPR